MQDKNRQRKPVVLADHLIIDIDCGPSMTSHNVASLPGTLEVSPRATFVLTYRTIIHLQKSNSKIGDIVQHIRIDSPAMESRWIPSLIVSLFQQRYTAHLSNENQPTVSLGIPQAMVGERRPVFG